MVDAREVALLRLAAQGLLGPRLPTARDAVAHLLAAQAQDLPGARTSVALRTAGGTTADVRAAQDAGEIARTWPMRGTLHLLATDDLPWMVGLLAGPRAPVPTRRWAELGLDAGLLARARALAEDRLAGGRALLRAELMALWEDAGLPARAGAGYHLLARLAQDGVLCLGPTRGAEDQAVLVEEWIPRPRVPDRDEALGELALRYLRGHGPATEADLKRWSGLGLRDVRAGVAVARAQLEAVDVGGVEHLMDPGVPDLLARHRAEAEAVRMLPGFDEMVLGYLDRTATVPAEHAGRVVPGGNGVFRGTVLHRGTAVGTWRWEGSGARRRPAPEPFTAFEDDVVAALPGLAAALPS